MNRCFDFRGVLHEIFITEETAVGFGEAGKFLRDISLVKAIARRLERGVKAARFRGFFVPLQAS